MRLNSSFLLLSRCLFNSKNKPVCQEHPENLNVHLLLIIRLIFNSTKITFFNIVWDTPSITVTSILYFTSISTFSGGLTKSLSISFSSTPAIFAIALWEYRHIVNLNMVCFIFISEINTLILGQVFNKVISLCSKSGKWKSYCKKYLCI